MQIVKTNVLPGTTLTLPITITAAGGENALGFSLTFDPTRLRYLGATKAPGAINAFSLACSGPGCGSSWA